MRRDANSWLHPLLLVVAIGVGIYLRLQGLTELPLFGDEYHTLDDIERGYGELVRSFGSMGSHAALPLLQRACEDLFGPGVLSFRLPAVAAGIAALLVCYPVARGLVGPVPALLTAIALSVNPMHVFYTRFARSYALTVLLALLLVYFLRRASVSGEGRRWPLWLGVIATAGLLPYVHTSSLGTVVALALASLLQAWWKRGSARDLLPPLAAFVLAGLLCAALYLPAREAVLQYLELVSGRGPAGPVGALDVATLLVGGRIAGLVGLVAVPLAVSMLWRSERECAVWIGAAVAGPLVAMLAFRPHGMVYAYARYLLIALPFMLMAIFWLLVNLTRRFDSGSLWSRQLALAAGLAAIVLLHSTGPLSPWRAADGPFSNTYLAMRALPAFDVAHPETPAFYRSLAEDREASSIIEAPLLRNRSVLLYRNYYLQHGKRTLIGLVGGPDRTLRNGPYAWLDDPDLVAETGADYLILHLDPAAEAARYWRYVYEEAWPSRGRGDEAYMVRQERYGPPRAPRPERVAQLMSRFGEPVFRDSQLIAWRLRPAEPPSPPEPEPEPEPTSGVQRPNFLLLSIDTLRPDHLGCYGYTRDTSPNIDRLAENSAVYEDATAPTPWTLPSHVAMLTGRHPYELGIRNRRSAIPEGVSVLAEPLQAAGYETAAFVDSTPGGFVGARRGFGRGFGSYSHVSEQHASKYRFDMAKTVDASIRWLQRRDSARPFFLFVHTKSAHDTPRDVKLLAESDAPYHKPQRYRTRFLPGDDLQFSWSDDSGAAGVLYLWALNDRIARGTFDRDAFPDAKLEELVGLYDGGIYYVDEHFGRLLREIDRLGLQDDTVIIVTSDHGEAFLEHHFFLHKELYRDLLRIPLIVHDPRRGGPGRLAQRVTLADLAPTVLQRAGVAIPEEVTGRPLPLHEDQVVEARPLFSFFHYRNGYFYQGAALHEGPWKLIRHRIGAGGEFRTELYHTQRDATEQQPIAADARRAEAMRARLEAWLEQGASHGSPQIEFDSETLEELRAMGYVR